MLSKILMTKRASLLTLASRQDQTHIEFGAAYPGTPQAFCPPTGAASRALADRLVPLIDVARTLERSAPTLELVAFARSIGETEFATSLARAHAWQAQGAIATPRRVYVPRETTTPEGKYTLPEQVTTALPAPVINPLKRKATAGMVARVGAYLQERWG